MSRFETLEPDWLSVSEARDRILSSLRPLPREDVPLHRVRGRVLARPLQARVTLPPWDNSAMDGYAVRADDVAGASSEAPVTLRVSGAVHAGERPESAVGPGEAARIMTGAPLPPGTDTVIRVEDTDAESGEEGVVRILSDRDRGRHIRASGEDAAEGERLLEEGTVIGPGQVAALASQGYSRVPVRRRPRVAVLPTGDELAPLEAFDRVRAREAIPESNGPTLAAAISEAGGSPDLLAVAPDTRDGILDRLEPAREADLLVTIGGASMGEADLLKRVLLEEGYETDFWRVRIRPGSPFGFGHIPRRTMRSLPVFGLPGNPSSAFVTYEVFVRPYLLSIAGHPRPHRRVLTATAAESLRSKRGLTHFLRVRLRGNPERPEALLAGPQGSGLVRSLAHADGLAVVPEEVEEIPSGDAARVVVLGSGPGERGDPGF